MLLSFHYSRSCVDYWESKYAKVASVRMLTVFHVSNVSLSSSGHRTLYGNRRRGQDEFWNGDVDSSTKRVSHYEIPPSRRYGGRGISRRIGACIDGLTDKAVRLFESPDRCVRVHIRAIKGDRSDTAVVCGIGTGVGDLCEAAFDFLFKDVSFQASDIRNCANWRHAINRVPR